MTQFQGLVTKLYNDYEQTVAKDQEDSYVRLSQIVDAVSDSLREYAQEINASEIQRLAEKLKKFDAALLPEDIELLRMSIIGDAESYVNTENSVPDWKKELQRVMQEVSRFSGDQLTVPETFKLQALLRDADRVIDDLAFYAAQKDRVAKFNTAVTNLSPEDRGFLFGLLNTKLKSKYY